MTTPIFAYRECRKKANLAPKGRRELNKGSKMTGIITLVGVEHDSKTPIQTLFEILLKNLLKGYTQLENRLQLDTVEGPRNVCVHFKVHRVSQRF